jgi:hypothetical protein
MTDLRYPIGKFTYGGHLAEDQKRAFLDDIARAPKELRAAVRELSEAQLETPYRPGGWTVREVVHHVPDSHLNSYVRFKLALTEDEPTIKPYAEDRWAQLADTRATPVEVSFDSARIAARSLDASAAVFDSRGVEADVPSSGFGSDESREDTRAIRLARTPSRGAYHGAAGKKRLVAFFSLSFLIVISSKATTLAFFTGEEKNLHSQLLWG